jgi:hypothetical protein
MSNPSTEYAVEPRASPSSDDHLCMGIRYYAYPIRADLALVAREMPRAFLGEDPLMDAWGPEDERPQMLYLDKCWRELQLLFATPAGAEQRAALSLVSGSVTHTNEGWIPHIRVLDRDEVAGIAEDIVTVGESEVRTMLTPNGGAYPPDGFEGEFRYVMHYLNDAKEFSSRLAKEGRGLVYMIG